jgi:hypothetical protein
MLALIACSAVLAACGGGDTTDETTAAASAVLPEPAESVDEFATRFEEATAAAVDGDSDAVDEFNDQASFFLPCPTEGDDYADLEVTGTDAFGPAGVVDFTDKTAPDGATAVVALNEDGRYRLIQSAIPSSIGLASEQVGTEPEETEIADEVVNEFVRATREKDCDVYFQVALTPTQDKQKECRLQFADKSQVTPDLVANPDAAPEPLGGTEAYRFYGLETDDAYRVMVAMRNANDVDPEDPLNAYRVISYRVQN